MNIFGTEGRIRKYAKAARAGLLIVKVFRTDGVFLVVCCRVGQRHISYPGRGRGPHPIFLLELEP